MRALDELQTARLMRVPRTSSARRQVTAAVKAGRAIRPLPGIIMSAQVRDDYRAWVFATWMWRPSAIVAGRAALCLQGVEGITVQSVDVLLPYTYADRGRLRYRRCELPPELVTDCGHGPVVVPAAAALLLGVQGDLEAVCAALKQRITTVGDMRQARALLRYHPAARKMDRVLRYVSQSPWSVAELEVHELLRLVGITGWTGNPKLILHPSGHERGRICYPDAAFEAEKLALEVASETYHNNSMAFAMDTLRARWFAAEGWTQMPVTPAQVRRDPNAFLADLCSRLNSRHRPSELPWVEYTGRAPFWRIVDRHEKEARWWENEAPLSQESEVW